ncbi:MAG: nitrogen regulation protein NR(II) [Rhodoferax sp.]
MPAPAANPSLDRFKVFDLCASLIAVADANGRVLVVNSALEDALAVSRRRLLGTDLTQWTSQPEATRNVLQAVVMQETLVRRFDTVLRRTPREDLPVQASASWIDGALLLIEMLPVPRQHRLDREDRLAEQVELNKELIRNLAHEIKNPLGGIRGAAQLLALELPTPELTEYTEVIIHEADRLQILVDRLLEPHRQPHEVGDVNIHEVCERVRSLILAEFAQGLRVVQDYDASLPEFRGDRAQLIQALLNIVRNAAQALSERRRQGDAVITLRTRVARQVTLGRQRYRLALELHVIDNGPGISDSIKDRIFFPLVSGREGGSGLGLTLAQTFVQQHRGVIECHSQPGCTDFKILIPLP